FDDLVQRLDKQPARVPMTDPDSGITYSAVFSGATFRAYLIALLYSTRLLPLLLQMIHEAQAGNYETFGHLAGGMTFDRTASTAMGVATVCAEMGGFDPTDVAGPDLSSAVAERERREAQQAVERCRRWGITPLEPDSLGPVSSNVPTLLLAGHFDPI